jgi:hypothetical protein
MNTDKEVIPKIRDRMPMICVHEIAIHEIIYIIDAVKKKKTNDEG